MPSVGALLESVAPDARIITFPFTDGDSSRWPANTHPPPSSARDVNWHRKMTMDEKYACRWRNLIGQGIAKLLDKPDKEKYSLQSFPEGYWMFDHNKGPISNPRHDLYLHGSKTVMRFRSPAEFIPHGYWLLTDPTLNRQNCGCKYCGGGGKKTQTEISEALGLPTNRGPTAVTGSAGFRNGKRPGPRLTGRSSNPAVASGGPWVPKESRALREMDPEWRLMNSGQNLVSSSMRTSDLRSNRLFRLGELVWCQWNAETPRTEKGKDVDHGPRPWPAIIIDYSLDISVDPSFPLGFHGSDSIIQRRKYVLRLLGAQSLNQNMEYECTRGENEILPWHAHKPDQLFAFSKRASNRSNDILDPFAFALITGENLVKFWAVCDRLPIEVSLSTPAANMEPESSIDSPGVVLPVTPKSLKHKTHLMSAHSTPLFSTACPVDTPPPPQPSPSRLVPVSATRNRRFSSITDTPIPVSSSSISKATSSRRIDEPLDCQSRVAIVPETRYQGLWYGAERIWTGDLVRLAPDRQAFAKSLDLSVTMHNDKPWKERVNPSPGAEMRGTLMRVDKIFARIGENGAKECAVAGPLYELAPADWVDPAGDSKSILELSWQSSDRSSTGMCEQTYPWNMAEVPPPPRHNEEPKREHLFDVPPFVSPVTPPGFFLRPLLPVGFEISLPVSYIAGRYYPEVLKSSLLDTVLLNISEPVRSLSDFLSADLRSGKELLSLCALAPGRYNCAVCVDVRLASRTGMLQEAVRAAKVGNEQEGAMNTVYEMQNHTMDLE